MKVHIVVELPKDGIPKVLGVFRKKSDAEKVAYTGKSWCNIIEKELE